MKDSAMMFKAVRELSRKSYENPYIYDDEGYFMFQKLPRSFFQNCGTSSTSIYRRSKTIEQSNKN